MDLLNGGQPLPPHNCSTHRFRSCGHDLAVRVVFLFLGAATLNLITSCGQPGAPQPPSLNLLLPVRNLSATRTGNIVHLEWTVTDRTTDHTVPASPIRTRICRVEGSGPCETVTEQPTPLGKGASWDDTLPTDETQGAPQLLTYYLELLNHAQKSAGRSNPGFAASGFAMPEIDSPTASVLSRGVELQWQPVQWPASTQGQRVVRIVRSVVASAPVKPAAPGTRHAAPQRASEPATQLLEVAVSTGPGVEEAARALDESARFDETYSYQLQRVEKITLDHHAIEILGPPSAPISITTRDVFPPAVPQQLFAVADDSSHAIDLSWLADSEPDLAGYYVYRQEKASAAAKPQRISGSTPLAMPAYHDTTVQPGRRYSYQVSAVDQTGNESLLSNEADESLASQPH